MQINQRTFMNAREMFVAVIALQFALSWCAKTEKEVIAYPSVLEERTAGESMVLKITEDITLNLERSFVLADELLFVTSGKEEHRVEKVDTSSIQKDLYHDTHRQASVMVRSIDGAVQVEGILDSVLRIKPLLQAPRSLDGQIPHKVYEVEEKLDSRAMRMAYGPSRKRGQWNRQRKNNTRRHEATNQGNSDVFVVEVHIISDMKHQRSFKKNEELIAYMAVTTNAVNLRYLDMQRPKISFILVGITRSKDDAFATKHQGMLDAPATLGGLEKYIDNGRVPGSNDIVMLVTGLDMFNRPNGKINNGLAGLAFCGTVCQKLKIGESEDIATTYNGVTAIAHELCHVMGSPHDETPECPWEEGYLMSYVDGGLKKYRLSPCSEKSMRNVYQKLKPECIQVQAKVNLMKDHQQYPGQTVRAMYYCKKVLKQSGGRWFVQHPDHLSRQCKMSCCHQLGVRRTCYIVTILTGMSCGRGKTCRRGVCGRHDYP
uniref:Putative secreted metalloprotease n=1 Tax=Rhipicephalus microplus TaxID=6941 RepID=A0A6G5A2V4_RHIMP